MLILIILIFYTLDLNVPNNALVIKGPPLLVEGDNVTLECGASIYEYQYNFQWVHRNINNVENYISINESESIY